ncbi:MAG TPA: hypothetical protein VNT99_00465 [Methylomirabilota bacterium]|nr:hypothetical protein [Methylomirabilota bacterium]
MTNNSSESAVLQSAAATLATRVKPCPSAKTGVHQWLFSAALVLKRARHSEQTACVAIGRAVANCGRPVPDYEIESAVHSAFNSKPGPKTPGWPTPNASLIAEVGKQGPSLAQLQARSPVEVAALDTDNLIDALFPGDSTKVILSVGVGPKGAITRPKGTFSGCFEHYAFIVPNPMCAVGGKNKRGEDSRRCLSNTGLRRFLVVENDPTPFEKLPKEQQSRFGDKAAYIAANRDKAAAVLWHLAGYAPLTLIVDSAGRSIHGWFFVAGESEEQCRKFFRYAVALGADRMLWTRCQFVRMPNGTRDNGKRQSVLYFNPQSMESK